MGNFANAMLLRGRLLRLASHPIKLHWDVLTSVEIAMLSLAVLLSHIFGLRQETNSAQIEELLMVSDGIWNTDVKAKRTCSP